MDTGKLNDWLQIVAAVGVVAGLVLVAYELRQQQDLAYAQLVSDMYNAQQALNKSLQEAGVAQAYAKSTTAPESLTLDEQLVLNGLFHETVQVLVNRQEYMVRIGLFRDDPAFGASIAGQVLFANAYGRAWWEEIRLDYEPVTRELMDEAAKRDYPTLDALERAKQRAASDSQ